MQEYFYEIARTLDGLIAGNEVYLAAMSGEESDFIRLNGNKVRQAGTTKQCNVGIDLIEGDRVAGTSVTLSGEPAIDEVRLATAFVKLRETLPHVPADPYLSYATEVLSTETVGEDRLPSSANMLDELQSGAEGMDAVGLIASGAIHAGFANSLGQRNWFSSHSFNVDWSLYHEADKAVKSGYAGFEWEAGEFARRIAESRERLAILKRPSRTIDPGEYRVYLTPAALSEFLGTIGWAGFGMKARQTKQSSLIRMIEDGATLDPRILLRENTGEGVGRNFDFNGFQKPDEVRLIDGGKIADALVSVRSAKEYGVPSNGADDWESPSSLDMAGGELPLGKVLEELGTGVYVSNLWYMNYSDPSACRMTGMTRFATLWVEDGKIIAPLNVMRFDESAYRVLGENLVDLTREREFIVDSESYGGRSTQSVRVPGALVDKFRFTL